MIKYDVPYVAQLRTHSCWYACTQMLWQYRHPGFETGATPDFTKRVGGSGDAFSQLLAASPLLVEAEGAAHSGTGATEKDWPILRHLGFGEIPCKEVEAIRMPTTDETLIKRAYAQLELLLTNHGPLWSAGYFFDMGRKDTSKGGHAILLTGVDQVKVAGSLKPCVFFNDPAASNGGSKDKRKLFDWFRTALFNTTDESEGISPMWYLPVSQTAAANWAKLRAAVKGGTFKASGKT